ncbi:MAG TPA: bacteriohemerythrin [Syntrophales bacterium]|nr:bacteriohemerythrin [Syntrophales bacterium]
MQAEHIVWDPKFSIHIDEIDAQHRELFAAVNELIDLLAGSGGELYPVMKKLVDYLSRHFRAEQKLMIETGYPYYARHVGEHRLFTDKVEEFLGKYKEQDKSLIQAMVLFLRHWFYSHTTTIDMKFADFLKDRAK